MLRSIIKIAFRNLTRNKIYSLINISGLSIGIACCLLITLYVKDELSFDSYHTNLNQIYRVVHHFSEQRPLAPKDYQVWGSYPVGPALANEFPEVQKLVTISGRQEMMFQHNDRRFQEHNIFFADSTTFDVFSWKMIEGNAKEALTGLNSLVLTESMAKKYFGNESALGQTIIIDNDTSLPMVVTGVIEDVPSNSHFSFDALISMATWKKIRPDIFKYWGYVDFYTYFLVPDNFDRAAFEAKIPAFLKKYVPESDINYTIAIEPMTDAYLHSEAQRQPGTTGSLSNLYIFSTIAVFILLVACINFMNLSTARSLDRAKEVGVRKSLGAQKSGLIQQFLSEAILISIVATLIALAIAGTALPLFEILSDKHFDATSFFKPNILLALLGLAIFVGFIAGSYPALVLSRFKPALVLKGVFRNSTQGALLRKGLVVFQFGLSVILIAGSLIVFSQLAHLKDESTGFTKDQMLIIDFGWDGKVQENINAIKNSLGSIPSVISISAQRTVPGGFFPKAGTGIQDPDNKMTWHDPDLYEIDYDFISNFDLKIVAGRDYSRDYATDSTQAMIVNEACARAWGYSDPEQIVGKTFEQWGKKGLVIGVVKDFNYRSLHFNVEPLTLRLSPQYSAASIALRVNGNNMHETIRQAEEIWNRMAPQRPFIYSFLDDSFNSQYRSDERFGSLFTVFAGLAVFIACFGLFGLTTYTVQQRTKEIGIRKTLGASVGSIVTLLSKDFILLVFIAIVMATPVAWYVMDQWLNEFAYRISIGAFMLIIPGVLVIVVSLLVVAAQAFKSANTDPVKALRTE